MLGERWRGDGLALRARLGIQLQETKFPEKLRVQRSRGAVPQLLPARARASATLLALVGLEEKARRATCARSRAARSSGCRSAARSSATPSCSSSTSRPPASTRSRAARPGRSSRALKARGRTVLLTTHYMEEAARLCDRVAIVDHGKVIALGTPRELIASLGAEHVVEFAVAEASGAPSSARRCAALPSVEGVARDGGSWRLTVREVHRAVPALLAALCGARREPTHLTTHHATLEDVFMALTGRRLRDG